MRHHGWLLIPFLIALPIAGLAMQRAVAPPAASPSTLSPGATTTRVLAAAEAFLTTLSAGERTRVTYGFTSSQRTIWSNLPSGMFRRNGMRLGDLTPAKRQAALALVAAALSKEGYAKVTDIMNGDEVLKNAGGGRTG